MTMKMAVTVMVEAKNGNDNDLYDVDDNGLNLCLSLIYVPSAEERLQIILITC